MATVGASPEAAPRWQRSRPSPLAALQNYLLRHVQTMVGALGKTARAPFSSGMTMAVIGIALALPAALHLLLVNGKALGGVWETVADLSVYLEAEVSEERAAELVTTIAARPEVSDVELISSAQALEEFRRLSGFGAALDALNENPLPATLVVRPAPGHDSASAVTALGASLQELPEADLVQIDTDWVRRFHAMLDVSRRAMTLAAGLLALAVVLVVGNTIRLDIQNRRQEIEVTKLVGGSDAFVRRPFLYGGLWYGLGGGLAALALTELGLMLLRGPVADLAALYGSNFRLIGLRPVEAAALVGSGALLGWLGSWIAATRHLRAIEPA